MRALFIVDLITLLPLFIVGGTNALWWVGISACIGVVGLALSYAHLREALTAAQSINTKLSLPWLGLIALGSIMLIVPGLISDLVGLICFIGSLRLGIIAYRFGKHAAGHRANQQSFHTNTGTNQQRKNRRIIDVSSKEVGDD